MLPSQPLAEIVGSRAVPFTSLVAQSISHAELVNNRTVFLVLTGSSSALYTSVGVGGDVRSFWIFSFRCIGVVIRHVGCTCSPRRTDNPTCRWGTSKRLHFINVDHQRLALWSFPNLNSQCRPSLNYKVWTDVLKNSFHLLASQLSWVQITTTHQEMRQRTWTFFTTSHMYRPAPTPIEPTS